MKVVQAIGLCVYLWTLLWTLQFLIVAPALRSTHLGVLRVLMTADPSDNPCKKACHARVSWDLDLSSEAGLILRSFLNLPSCLNCCCSYQHSTASSTPVSVAHIWKRNLSRGCEYYTGWGKWNMLVSSTPSTPSLSLHTSNFPPSAIALVAEDVARLVECVPSPALQTPRVMA